MKKVSLQRIVIWIAQAAAVGFTIPTILRFVNNPGAQLTFENSYFVMPIVITLIGFTIIGEAITTYVLGLTAFVLLIMLLCVILFQRALKYGIFLFAVVLLDVTTLFAWFKGEVFEVSRITEIFYTHIVVMIVLIAGMIAAYIVRVQKHKSEVELEELAEAEIEFEVKEKLGDPISEEKENTDKPVSSDS